MAFIPPVLDFNFRITGAEDIQRRFADVHSGVQKLVRHTLEIMAERVVAEAKARVPRGRGPTQGKRLADMIGYRFTLGRSGISKDSGDRVVIRADVRGRGDRLKAKAYAVEMGQLGRTKTVKSHRRQLRTRVNGGRRISAPFYVSAYQRRFMNAAHPFLGPAGAAALPDIRQALEVVLPRRIARMLEDSSQAWESA